MTATRSRPRHAAALLATMLAAASVGGCVQEPPTPAPAVPAAEAAVQPVPGATLKLADEVREAGDLDSAGALYRVAAQEQPDDAIPLLRLGEVELQRRAFDKSAGAYRAALTLAPEHAGARLGLARAHVAAGQPQAAIDVLDGLISPPAGSTARDVLAVRGIALDMLGRHDEAQALYRQGLAVAPRDLRLQNNLALSLVLSGSAPAAVVLLREAAADPLANDRHRRNLALALAASGDEGDARRVLQPLPAEQVNAVLEAGRTIRKGRGRLSGASHDLGVMTLP